MLSRSEKIQSLLKISGARPLIKEGIGVPFQGDGPSARVQLEKTLSGTGRGRWKEIGVVGDLDVTIEKEFGDKVNEDSKKYEFDLIKKLIIYLNENAEFKSGSLIKVPEYKEVFWHHRLGSFVYVLKIKSKDGKDHIYYVGETGNIFRRFNEHKYLFDPKAYLYKDKKQQVEENIAQDLTFDGGAKVIKQFGYVEKIEYVKMIEREEGSVPWQERARRIEEEKRVFFKLVALYGVDKVRGSHWTSLEHKGDVEHTLEQRPDYKEVVTEFAKEINKDQGIDSIDAIEVFEKIRDDNLDFKQYLDDGSSLLQNLVSSSLISHSDMGSLISKMVRKRRAENIRQMQGASAQTHVSPSGTLLDESISLGPLDRMPFDQLKAFVIASMESINRMMSFESDNDKVLERTKEELRGSRRGRAKQKSKRIRDKQRKIKNLFRNLRAPDKKTERHPVTHELKVLNQEEIDKHLAKWGREFPVYGYHLDSLNYFSEAFYRALELAKYKNTTFTKDGVSVFRDSNTKNKKSIKEVINILKENNMLEEFYADFMFEFDERTLEARLWRQNLPQEYREAEFKKYEEIQKMRYMSGLELGESEDLTIGLKKVNIPSGKEVEKKDLPDIIEEILLENVPYSEHYSDDTLGVPSYMMRMSKIAEAENLSNENGTTIRELLGEREEIINKYLDSPITWYPKKLGESSSSSADLIQNYEYTLSMLENLVEINKLFSNFLFSKFKKLLTLFVLVGSDNTGKASHYIRVSMSNSNVNMAEILSKLERIDYNFSFTRIAENGTYTAKNFLDMLTDKSSESVLEAIMSISDEEYSSMINNLISYNLVDTKIFNEASLEDVETIEETVDNILNANKVRETMFSGQVHQHQYREKIKDIVGELQEKNRAGFEEYVRQSPFHRIPDSQIKSFTLKTIEGDLSRLEFVKKFILNRQYYPLEKLIGQLGVLHMISHFEPVDFKVIVEDGVNSFNAPVTAESRLDLFMDKHDLKNASAELLNIRLVTNEKDRANSLRKLNARKGTSFSWRDFDRANMPEVVFPEEEWSELWNNLSEVYRNHIKRCISEKSYVYRNLTLSELYKVMIDETLVGTCILEDERIEDFILEYAIALEELEGIDNESSLDVASSKIKENVKNIILGIPVDKLKEFRYKEVLLHGRKLTKEELEIIWNILFTAESAVDFKESLRIEGLTLGKSNQANEYILTKIYSFKGLNWIDFFARFKLKDIRNMNRREYHDIVNAADNPFSKEFVTRTMESYRNMINDFKKVYNKTSDKLTELNKFLSKTKLDEASYSISGFIPRMMLYRAIAYDHEFSNKFTPTSNSFRQFNSIRSGKPFLYMRVFRTIKNNLDILEESLKNDLFENIFHVRRGYEESREILKYYEGEAEKKESNEFDEEEVRETKGVESEIFKKGFVIWYARYLHNYIKDNGIISEAQIDSVFMPDKDACDDIMEEIRRKTNTQRPETTNKYVWHSMITLDGLWPEIFRKIIYDQTTDIAFIEKSLNLVKYFSQKIYEEKCVEEPDLQDKEQFIESEDDIDPTDEDIELNTQDILFANFSRWLELRKFATTVKA
jgi:hypothetical protein